MLVLTLLLTVSLQLALLIFVAAAWTETSQDSNASQIALSTHYTQDLSTQFLLTLTEVASLCALALYTHAEVQAAVDLFGKLRQQQQLGARGNAGSGEPSQRCVAVWVLAVPLLQLIIAALTLVVQGLVFMMSFQVPVVGSKDPKTKAVMDAVFACVALAFILELDNQIWVFVKPVCGASRLNTSSSCDRANTSSHIATCSLLALVNGCCLKGGDVVCSWLLHHIQSRRQGRLACAAQCGVRALTCMFDIIVIIYHCAFGMLLFIYATSYVFNDSPHMMAGSVLLSFCCFVVFQIVAGVRSARSTGTHCCCTPAWVRPLFINLAAPICTAVFARVIWTVFTNQVLASTWRCTAGAVIDCAHTSPPCKDPTSWCTSTTVCNAACTGGNPAAAAAAFIQGVVTTNLNSSHSAPCMGSWCSNVACIQCLLRDNGTFPPVVLSTGPLDVPMCSGAPHSYYSCMHAWMTFMPLAFMLLLAGGLLLYERKQCRCQLGAFSAGQLPHVQAAGVTQGVNFTSLSDTSLARK
jgi:hypothetical protein